MEAISINEIQGVRIGQVEDEQAATGVTVIICEDGMAAGLDVRGGGPASRDTRVLDPLAAAERIHAVVFSGGSAYGLDAAGGVMRYLEERGIGLRVGDACVPLVSQSCIFDLLVGEMNVRPDDEMGYAACVASEVGNYRDGNFGAGCGATVGKLLGGDYCMKAGIGSHAVRLGSLVVGALVVVNALGDVIDPSTGQTVAGLRDDGEGLRSTADAMYSGFEALGAEQIALPEQDVVVSNTTIGAVLTNAKLSKAQLCKLAGMAHDGYARAIRPVHTSMDGDSIYALSVSGYSQVEAPLDLLGTLAADVMVQAILMAARSSEPAYGFPSAYNSEV